MLAFMANILVDLSRGDAVEIKDIWKLDDIVKELEAKGEE